MGVCIDGDDKVRPHVPALRFPVGNGFQHITRHRAQLFFPYGQPRGIARRLQPGMFHPCAEVTTPAVRFALQIGHVRHVHEAQAAFKLLFNDVLMDFHRAAGVRRAGRVVDKSYVKLLTEVRYQGGRIGRAGVGIENARQAVRRIMVAPVRHEVDQGAQDALGRFAGRLLVPEYIGWNSVIRTDIPIFFNRYTMNKYPERLSVLGLLNYIVTILTSLGYWYCITDFLFLRFIDPNWALWALFALVGEAVLFFALENWNCSERRDPAVVITRQGMRQIRAAKRVRCKRKKEGKRG